MVVVNYNGGDLTLRCLRSLEALAWPRDRLRLVLVDNASADGVVARVGAEHPAVDIVETGSNVGFGAGCNAGIARLADVDYVALVNNDATVEAGWLAPLVAACDDAARVGAACPKILLAGRFGAVEIVAPTTKRGRGDYRPLGVQVRGLRVDGTDVWAATQLVSGFWGREPDAEGQWTAERALLHVPVNGTDPVTVELCLVADERREVVVSADATRMVWEVGTRPAWFSMTASFEPFDVLNSAGGLLVEGGYGADRGYLQPDRGQFDELTEVFAWSGAGVVLSRSYLADVGLFHEPLFLYYEDLDLSWRGRARQWRHVYVPDAIERHEHAASSVVGSTVFDHYVERNRLVVLTRNAPAGMAWRAVGRFVLTTVSYARRDCLVPLLFLRAPRAEVVRRRARAFVGYLRLLPAALVQRVQLNRRRTLRDPSRRWLAPALLPGPTSLPTDE